MSEKEIERKKMTEKKGLTPIPIPKRLQMLDIGTAILIAALFMVATTGINLDGHQQISR